jgi:hypothetical protein
MILLEEKIRAPREGDIWLVHYPYITPGNMEKIRPAIIKSINEEEETVTVQKLTTRKKRGNKFFSHPKMKRTTFISKEIIKIHEYNLVRYIGNLSQGKRVIK